MPCQPLSGEALCSTPAVSMTIDRTSTGDSQRLAQAVVSQPPLLSPPSVISAIILASKAPRCTKWQSAFAKKDWSGEPSCSAWHAESSLSSGDRIGERIPSAQQLSEENTPCYFHSLSPLGVSTNLLLKSEIASSGILLQLLH